MEYNIFCWLPTLEKNIPKKDQLPHHMYYFGFDTMLPWYFVF